MIGSPYQDDGIDLRQLRYFVALADELHFGRAASRLALSQPSLSQQIAGLERRLGVALFIRDRRTVEATEAGRLLLPEARAVLAAAARAVAVARAAGVGGTGHLVIGYVPSTDCNAFTSMIRTYRQRHPGVEIELRALGGAAQIEAVRAGSLAIGFVRLPIDVDPALAVEVIDAEPLAVVLPSGHALATRVRVPLTALSGLPYIHFPRVQAPGLYDSINAWCLAAGFSPQVAMEADHTQACLALVAGGLGVALLPASAEQVRRDGVVFRPLTPRVMVRTAMVYRRERPPALLANLLAVVRGR